MTFTSRIGLILSAVLFASTTANASLVETDFLSPGDKLLTKDLNTGMYWLDLTQTTNISYENVLMQLEPGGAFNGFRYASVYEVDQLQQSAGLASGLFYNASSIQRQKVNDLIEMVGVTRNDGGRLFSDGITMDPFSPTSTIDDRIIRGFSLTLGSSAHQGVIGDSIASPSVGSWLVRDTLTTVPIPSSLILFASAAGLMIPRMRFRKQTRPAA